MNKLGKRKYVKLIAEVLADTCAVPTEHGTDVKMAEAVVKSITEFLYFHPHDMGYKEFLKWKRERKCGK